VTDIEIAGLALGWIGTRGLNSFDEDTDEARLCEAFFGVALDSLLEDRVWTFATRRVKLDPDAEAPLFGYAYKFLIPAYLVRVHRVDEPDGDGRLDWRREGNYILANAPQVCVIGIERVTDTSLYSPSFCLALAAKLASLIVVALEDDVKKQGAMLTLAEKYLKDAAAMDGSQGRAERIRSDSISRMR
jgi:hypothetical protein